MSEPFDAETGEIIQRGPMPPEIAKAIVAIMKQTKQVGFDDRNEHGKYNYASIDKFLAVFRPLCADQGLIIMLDEIACEFHATGERQTSYAYPTYAVWLIHESGVTWGPLTRRLSLPATGPQAFGAAESYVLKQFMRNLFQVPTGEQDADELPEGNIPARQMRGNGARHPQRPTGVPQSDSKRAADARYKQLREMIDGGQVVEPSDMWDECRDWYIKAAEERGDDPAAAAAAAEIVMESLRKRAEARPA